MKKLILSINNMLSGSKTNFWIFVFALIFLSVLAAICNNNLCSGDDFYFHLRRFISLADALRDGTFPVYIDYKAIGGYGYLSNFFYSDIVLLPFASIALISDPIFAYRFMLFVMTLLCGLTMYKTANYVYKNSAAAIVSSLLYTFCSYQIGRAHV